MKIKKMIVLLILGMAACTTGCGLASEIAEDAKKQMEWTEEHHALTDGKSIDPNAKKILDDVTDAILDSNDAENNDTDMDNTQVTATSSSNYFIGDTAPLISKSDSGNTYIDLTVTGYQQVYDSVNEKNAIAIFYTVTSKDGEKMTFDNTNLDVYADDVYVEAGTWEDWSVFSYGILMPGTTYEGCYVADVDAATVSKIVMYCGDTVWTIQESYVSNQTAEDSLSNDGAEWAGFYTDGINNASISIYSAPEEGCAGNYHFTLEGYGEISGELQYYPEDNIFLPIDSSICMTIWCLDDNGTKTINISIIEELLDDLSYGPLQMTEHYES